MSISRGIPPSPNLFFWLFQFGKPSGIVDTLHNILQLLHCTYNDIKKRRRHPAPARHHVAEGIQIITEGCPGISSERYTVLSHQISPPRAVRLYIKKEKAVVASMLGTVLLMIFLLGV